MNASNIKVHVLLPKNITNSPDGMNQFLAKSIIYFITQVINVDVNNVSSSVKLISPYMFGNQGTGQNLSFIV